MGFWVMKKSAVLPRHANLQVVTRELEDPQACAYPMEVEIGVRNLGALKVLKVELFIVKLMVEVVGANS